MLMMSVRNVRMVVLIVPLMADVGALGSGVLN